MLKFGDKIISNLYFGDKRISKAYMGSKLVYKEREPIFLDYIITDGNSWIDTGYYPDDTKSIVEYDFEVHTKPSGSYNGLFGSRVNTGSYVYNVFCKSNLELRLDYGVYNAETLYPVSLNTKYTIKAGMGEIYINDELVKSYKINFGLTPYSIYLGNFNQVNSTYETGTPQNIYGFRAYEEGVLTKDLRPCINPNGTACMYDMVAKKYHYKQGTGTITAGGRFVTSILFDGASVIDTGLPHQTCVIECDIRFEETGTRQLMGFGTGSGQYWGAGATGIFDYMSDTNALDRTLVVIDFNAEEINYTIYADGKSRTSANGNYLSSLTYRIGAGPTGVSSSSYWCTCEVWGNKFTNAYGVIIQDLRPYVDEDGIPCFYDTVTNVKFYNKGTGTLSYT